MGSHHGPLAATRWYQRHGTALPKPSAPTLLARFYRYKKQIAAGNMDSMPHVSVNATHPAVTAACWRSGKAAKVRETPPTHTSPPCLANAISITARSAGFARSGASLACTGAALGRSSMGSASVSGSNLNPLVGVADVAKPQLSDVSKDEDKDDDDDSSEMIIGNLFPHSPGVGGGGCGGDEYGEEEGGGEDNDIDFPNTDDADSVPDAEVNKYSFLEHLCITWMVTKSATRTESVLSGRFFSRWVLLCAIWTQCGLLTWRLGSLVSMPILFVTLRTNTSRETRCAQRCCIGSRLVGRICVVEIYCVGGRVKQPTSDRSGTNFWESVGCLTCQVDPIRSST